MVFTEEQIKIINFINLNKTTTMYELLQIDSRFNREEYIGDLNNAGKLQYGTIVYIIKEDDIEKIIYKIANINNLCLYLQDRKLIYIDDMEYGLKNIPFCTKNNYGIQNEEKKFNHYAKKYTKIKYIAAPTLDDFICNSYKTYEEIEIIKEREARQKAEKSTRNIAVFSIIVSLIIGVFSTILNILTYRDKRENVEKSPFINNPIEIQDMDKYLEIQENFLLKMDEFLIRKENEK